MIKRNKITCFDIDRTLLMWDFNSSDPVLWAECGGMEAAYNYHKRHIEQLKRHLYRNQGIVIWSQGGWEWAESATKALVNKGLLKEKEADEITVMEKPTWCYDDKPVEDWMPKPDFLEDI